MTTVPTVELRMRAARISVVLLAALAGALIASLARWGADWPAQEFRAWIAGNDGLTLLTVRWYGGSALPGYSVLYPLLTGGFHSGVVGAAVVGVLSCVAATWAASGLVLHAGLRRQLVFGLGAAFSVCESLLLGEIPFLLGCAFAVAALAALSRSGRWYYVAALACLASLASPLAGAFLLVVAPAVAVATDRRRAVPLAAGVTGSLIAVVVGGANGPFPCPWQTFAGVAAFCGLVLLCGPARNRALRVFALCYLVVDVAAFVVPNPVGGNVARLAKIVIVPLACYFLSTRTVRSWLCATLVVVVGIVRPGAEFVSSMTASAADPARSAGYYAGLLSYLRHRTTPPGRLEIPFTRSHWESYFVAKQYPIARGWERQSDLLYNDVLYHPLTAVRYRAWLDTNAVSLVALPDAAMDDGGTAEATLLRRPPDYLKPVWHDAHWQVWQVVHPTPLVSGPATLVDEDASSLTLDFRRAGAALVRMHASPLWSAQEPGGCVGATRHGWLVVRSSRPGNFEIAARLNAGLVTGHAPCTG